MPSGSSHDDDAVVGCRWVLKDEFEDGDGVRDDLKLVVVAGMMIQ